MTPTVHHDPDLSIHPPVHVERPTMLQRWAALTFVHRAYDPEVVGALLPPGLEVDTFDGAAWVGIIPFRLRIRVPGTPYLPWANTLDEVNVRTYVRGPDGGRGIWFLSLDAARLGAVVSARASYRIPYLWARMRTSHDGTFIRYRGRRRHPGAARAGFDLTVERGAPAVPTDLERFLTSRWHLYSPGKPRLPPTGVPLVKTTVEHEAWPLQAARVVRLDETLLTAAGLPAGETEATALFSPGVNVRFARRVPV